MINVTDKKNCCGCTACMNICPTHAITMIKNEDGFLHPIIDQEKCINCGACQHVCPFLNIPTNAIEKDIYACYSKDKELLMNSSSGGIFGELAQEVLLKKGKIIGVNSNFSYSVVDNIKNLKELFGAKYVEANRGDIFAKVKEELKNGILILFSGNPCIINGLKNYLKKDYSNLITCDFICHGIPSPKLLNSYKRSVNKKINNINFREKSHGWHNYSTVLSYNNKKFTSLAVDNPYMQAFYKNYSLRESCYNCKSKSNHRSSDITLGDNWSINEDNKIYNFYGNSIVIINTEKGQKIFESIKPKLQHELISSKSLENNSSYYQSVNRPKERDDFYKDVDKLSFKKVAKKYNLEPNFIRKIKIKIKNFMKG